MAELNYDYIAKLVRKTQAGDSDALPSSMPPLIKSNTISLINM